MPLLFVLGCFLYKKNPTQWTFCFEQENKVEMRVFLVLARYTEAIKNSKNHMIPTRENTLPNAELFSSTLFAIEVDILLFRRRKLFRSIAPFPTCYRNSITHHYVKDDMLTRCAF